MLACVKDFEKQHEQKLSCAAFTVNIMCEIYNAFLYAWLLVTVNDRHK